MTSTASIFLVAGFWLCAGAMARAAPNPDSAALAATLVDKSQAGDLNAMSGLIVPFPRLMREMGVTDPRHFPAIVHEAVMPVLNDHSDDLTDIQVRTYASLLSPADMKAAIAFYDSPAGKSLVRAKFKLLQTNMAQGGALLDRLTPEIQRKAQQVLKAHG